MDMTTLRTLKRRLAKIGVRVTFILEPPFVYLDEVNGRQVFRRFHGSTVPPLGVSRYLAIATCPPTNRPGRVELLNSSELFQYIREHVTNTVTHG